MKNKILILLSIIVTLAACGGGSGSSSTGTVSLLVTDNLTLTYSEVWVNIQSITATDANNQVVTLYQDATGQTHNLSQLANVGALVNAAAVAPGTYTSFQITMANNIKLIDQGGVVTNAVFDTTGNPAFSMVVAGNLVVDANQSASLALDFNLQQFTYDAVTNVVTPVVVQKDPATLNQTVATTPGIVQSVVSPTQFLLTPATGGANITVNLHASATVTSAATGVVTTDTAALQAGARVNVSGSYDAATLTITAASVLINNSTVIIRSEIEGIVTFFDGATLTVDVKEASFSPDHNTINVTGFDTAKYSRGDQSLLQVGRKIEVKGGVVNGEFNAAIIEIEGAQRNSVSDDKGYSDDYAELKGRVIAVNSVAQTVTVTVVAFEHVNGISVGNVVIINSAGSWISKGSSSCLVVNALIEAKGAMVADTATPTMDAGVIEIESGCGSSTSDDSDD